MKPPQASIIPKSCMIILLIALLALPAPAAADGLLNLTMPDPPNISINITPWDPESSYYTRYWFDWNDGVGTFQPYGFLQSIVRPLTDIFGYWIFCILWFIYLWGVWARERAIELTIVMMLITGPLWGLLLPPESYFYGYICLALGIAAIILRLVKSKLQAGY